jgi:glycosyltransferase involved in cell wall biosynthesis
MAANDAPASKKGGESQSLSVVVPFWNEEENARHTVSALMEICEGLLEAGALGGFELLLVDDASTDATGRILESLAKQDRRLRVLRHSKNRGLGGALKTGFAEARGSLVLYTDADLPVDPMELERALRLLRLYDAHIVSAYRLDRTPEGLKRVVYSVCYNLLTRLLFGLRLRDVNFAFKLFRRDILDRMVLRSEGSFVDVELLARAHRLGYRAIQFGADYIVRQRGTSSLGSWSVVFKVIKELLRLFWEVRRTEALPAGVLRAGAPRPEGLVLATPQPPVS